MTFSDRAIRRFWSHVNKSEGCWIWTANTNKRGYGKFRAEGTTAKSPYWIAHRFAWHITFGDIPDGMLVLHHCDVPACVNPSHLFIGTHQDNVDDCYQKGRQAKGPKHGRATKPECTARGDRNGNSKLTRTAVQEIRKLYSSGKFYQQEIAKMFAVTQTCVSSVVRGETWSK